MNPTLFQGVGYVAKAVAELCLGDTTPPTTLVKAEAFGDFLRGLGSLGVHTSIIGAMQEVPPVPPGVVRREHVA